MTLKRHKVTLYGKPECCLCDEAMEVLRKVDAVVSFDLEKIDISLCQELMDEFGLKIPVIFVDGVQAFKYRVNEGRLIKLLSADCPLPTADF
jgi:glutaredoxin